MLSPRQSHRPRFQQGLTLVELIVIIAVLAILATLIIPRVTGVVAASEESRALSDKAAVNAMLDSIEGLGGTVAPGAGNDVDTTSVETIMADLSSGLVIRGTSFVMPQPPFDTTGWAVAGNRVL